MATHKYMLAAQLQATIRREVDLSCSLGVASNKLVAKIATDVGKAAVRSGQSPSAICVVPLGDEAAFLAPLPALALWGVGPKTNVRLAAFGLTTIGNIAAWPEAELVRFFGNHGAELWRHAHGIDQRPIVIEHEAKSISQETTFACDVHDAALLRETICTQAATIGRKLRDKQLGGTTVKLKIRWPDFTTLTRQVTLGAPTDRDEEITEAALRLFAQTWQEGRSVRLIGVGIGGLRDAPRQLGLWDAPSGSHEQRRRVTATLDALRSKFGSGAVRRASELEGRDDERN